MAQVEFSSSPPDADDPFDFFLLPDGTRLIGWRRQGQFLNHEAVMPRAPVEAIIISRRQDRLEGFEKLRPVGHETAQPSRHQRATLWFANLVQRSHPPD